MIIYFSFNVRCKIRVDHWKFPIKRYLTVTQINRPHYIRTTKIVIDITFSVEHTTCFFRVLRLLIICIDLNRKSATLEN